MKTNLPDLARKWGVGLCLLLWCMVSFCGIAGPALLLLLLVDWVGPIAAKILLGIYAVAGVPLLAYYFGRAFGLRYGQMPDDE